jgi:hypothetical protein
VPSSLPSKEPGVAAFVKRVLEDAFYPMAEAIVFGKNRSSLWRLGAVAEPRHWGELINI